MKPVKSARKARNARHRHIGCKNRVLSGNFINAREHLGALCGKGENNRKIFVLLLDLSIGFHAHTAEGVPSDKTVARKDIRAGNIPLLKYIQNFVGTVAHAVKHDGLVTVF